MDIGTLTRSANDDYSIAVSYALVSVYVASPITGTPVVTVDVTGALVLGTATVSGNIVTFRVSPGTVVAPTCRITILPTNANSEEVERAVVVVTG